MTVISELTTIQAESPPEVVQIKQVIVEVTAGPDQGATVAADGAGVSAGSGSDCELRLSDGYVSRRHVAIRPHATGVCVMDRAAGTAPSTRARGSTSCSSTRMPR